MRLELSKETWERVKREARAQDVGAAMFAGLVLKNYLARPFKLEYLPERHLEEQ